jgi:hypothetical protein
MSTRKFIFGFAILGVVVALAFISSLISLQGYSPDALPPSPDGNTPEGSTFHSGTVHTTISSSTTSATSTEEAATKEKMEVERHRWLEEASRKRATEQKEQAIESQPRLATTTQDDECRAHNAELGVVLTDPSASCIELGDVLKRLRRGTFKFNKPTAATLGESFPMRLVLLTSEGQTADFPSMPGSVETRELRPFAQFLEATLAGDDFEISPPGPQARTATLAQPVEWEWRVKPTSSGVKSLTIDVAANIQIGASKNRIQLTTLHETIDIQVTIFQRLKTYLAGANGVIAAVTAALTSLVGLVGFVPKVRQFFKDYVLTLFRPKRPKRRRA